MPGFDFSEFGRALRAHRHQHGLTVRDVGGRIAISAAQVANVEAGKPVGLRTVLAVCRFLDCPVETFIPAEPVNSDTPYAPNGAAEQAEECEPAAPCK